MGFSYESFELTKREVNAILRAHKEQQARVTSADRGPTVTAAEYNGTIIGRAAVDRWQAENPGLSYDSYGMHVAPTVSREMLDRAHVRNKHQHPEEATVFPIADPSHVVSRTRSVTLEVNPADLSGHRLDVEAVMINRVLEKDPTAVLIKGMEHGRLRKPVARTTSGTSETRYFLHPPMGSTCRLPDEVAGRGFETLAKAKQAGTEVMESHPGIPSLTVRGRVVRVQDGEAADGLATIERPAQKVKVRVTYVSQVVQPDAPADSYRVRFRIHL